MLFNSYIFIFGFLPISLIGFFITARWRVGLAAIWLISASLAFYTWWNPVFLPVLLISVAFNYTMSELIGGASKRPILQRTLLILAVGADLTALFYYKHLPVLLGLARENGFVNFGLDNVTLPLGISFYTFTQIGYLVDVHQGVARDRGLRSYLLFVTFFPHLIAGPILHNREIMPQFSDPAVYRFSARNLLVGATLFIMGLCKKVLLADPTSPVVGAGFAHASTLPLSAAWQVALSYSLQIYFDFSGYSDMAIGLALMFNVKFPLNFNSPYKSANVIEFWQRWHMTLTRYLTLYLYNPIALRITRRRLARGLPATKSAHATVGGFSSMIAFPTMVTMLLAGVWHGAGLQFIIWGALHGVYITANHLWRVARRRAISARKDPETRTVHIGKVLLTYFAVLIASVFFRAPSAGSAVQLLAGMVGLHGVDFHLGTTDMLWLVALFAIVWGLPNTQQILLVAQPALGEIKPGARWLRWQMNSAWAVATGVAAILALTSIGGLSEFLYFQF